MPTSHSALSPELITAIEAGAWVLTPNQRSAHWLKLLYANYAVAQGRTAWATPAIHSFNAFVSLLWRAHGNSNERVLSSEQSRLLWERIVAASPWSELLLSPQAAAHGAFRAWERMHDWQIDRRSLAEHAEAIDSNEARALLEWSDRFSALCHEKSWLPVQWLPQRLLSTTSIGAHAHVVTLTDDLLPSQRRLLAHLAQCGLRWEQHRSQRPSGSFQVRSCDTLETELQSAACWARDFLRTGPASIAVVVQDLDQHAAQVRRTFADVFAQSTRTFVPNAAVSDRAQQEASFAIASYHSLVDFPIVRAALDMLELAMGRASNTLAGSLLRNQFLVASQLEASERALADKHLRSQAREYYDLAILQRTASNCPNLSKALSDALSVRRGAPSRALPSSMAEQFVLLWRALGWPGERALDSDEQQIVSRVQEALGEFGALDELLGPLDFNDAVREFERLVRDVSFEPRSNPAPITIIDGQAIDGLGFDAIWVTGMDETRWPPPPAPDAFIPIALQVRAGMPNATASLTREFARKQFLQLQSMANAVVFSWARIEQDVSVLPSAWLHEGGAPVEEPIFHEPYATGIFSAKPKLETTEEFSAPALARPRARGGTRIFELQSQCPFRAFAELRLDSQPLDEVAPSVDARERGTLIHAALADVWQSLGGSAGLHARNADELEVLVRTSLARHAAKLLDGASPHRVRMLQIEQDISAERILKLLHLDKGRTPFQVVGRPETQEQASIGALKFELRLDRMDELLDEPHRGERVIVDYKTSNSVNAQSWTSERPEQPQLPLYAVTHPHNLAAVSFVTVSAKGVGYKGVARDQDVLPNVKAFESKKLPSPHAGWDGLLSHWRVVIERLANEFASGQARVDPLPNACRYCHLSSVCRVNERAEAGLTALHDDDEDSE